VSKRGTPTMGGLMIVLVLDVTTLLWAQWNTLIQLTLLTVVVLCGLGFIDDYAKITQQNSKGVQEFIKLWVQGALAIFVAFYLWRLPATSALISQVMVPFYKYPVAQGAVRRGAGHHPDRPDHRGQLQRGQPDRRPGRPGHRLHGHRLVRVSRIDVFVGQRPGTAGYLQIPHVPARGN
jgi:hypothetical protein